MRTVPVAAAEYVAPLCRGPIRSGAVSAVFSGALVLDCPAEHRASARTVVLLARRATAVPVGIRTVEPLPMAAVGTPIQVGEGGVAMPGLTLRLARTWPSIVPRIDPDPGRLAELAGRAGVAPLGMDRSRLDILADALADIVADALADALADARADAWADVPAHGPADSSAGARATPVGGAAHAHRVNAYAAGSENVTGAVHAHHVNAYAAGSENLTRAVHAHHANAYAASSENLTRAVHDLVGRGAGATPAGDDVLAGAMVGLRARGRSDLVARLADAVDPHRTTPYSAALLTAAAAGHAALEALAVLRWLHAPGPPGKPTADSPFPSNPASAANIASITTIASPTKIVSGPEQHFSSSVDPQTMILAGDPVGRLLAVGHTSGADLAAGLLLGLLVPASAAGDAPPAHDAGEAPPADEAGEAPPADDALAAGDAVPAAADGSAAA